ncbi:MAG: hypothetical protein GY820_46405 [Gammaproteobacteria bacterium]|nr:hypothetical protein [Gammaproteobacteria bacterium]
MKSAKRRTVRKISSELTNHSAGGRRLFYPQLKNLGIAFHELGTAPEVEVVRQKLGCDDGGKRRGKGKVGWGFEKK